ncbi:MAG: hypothetical protein OEW65_09450 [Thermoleophilia bacterium]|nr:hypothetical protein [Thermoleophilia bacterium]
MRVIRSTVTRTCAICERTLLQGEQALRFSPGGGELVDVCTLCQDHAVDSGWLREGNALSVALHQVPRRRRQKTLWQALLGAREDEPEPVVSEPILRRLSDEEIALVEAAELFNQSQFRRTVLGVSRSLGAPDISIVPLSGVNAETVITFAWDITWYQYRVSPESAQPIRLADRGQDGGEIETPFTQWNATLDDDGRLVPELVRI